MRKGLLMSATMQDRARRKQLCFKEVRNLCVPKKGGRRLALTPLVFCGMGFIDPRVRDDWGRCNVFSPSISRQHPIVKALHHGDTNPRSGQVRAARGLVPRDAKRRILVGHREATSPARVARAPVEPIPNTCFGPVPSQNRRELRVCVENVFLSY